MSVCQEPKQIGKTDCLSCLMRDLHMSAMTIPS